MKKLSVLLILVYINEKAICVFGVDKEFTCWWHIHVNKEAIWGHSEEHVRKWHGSYFWTWQCFFSLSIIAFYVKHDKNLSYQVMDWRFSLYVRSIYICLYLDMFLANFKVPFDMMGHIGEKVAKFMKLKKKSHF